MEDKRERELIYRYKNGDKRAIEILINENYDKIKGYIFKLTCNKELTEDILHETLISAICNIEKFKPKAKFSTWLITIAINKYKDYLRRHKETDILIESLPSKYVIEDEVIKKDEINEVIHILRSLSVDKRNVFILKHYYGYSYEEICNIVGCKKGTVRSRLHYAIEEITNKFKGSKGNVR